MKFPLHHGIQMISGSGYGPDAMVATLDLGTKPLPATERGLVLSGRIRTNGESLTIVEPPSAEQIRRYALYWDRLDFPSNHPEETLDDIPDLAFLQAEGIVQRTTYSYGFGPSHNNPDGWSRLAQTSIDTFNSLDAAEPGRWSLARDERAPSFHHTDLIKGRALLFELHGVIPVPTGEVPLEDVLSFKEKHSSELSALRAELEDRFQNATDSPDAALAATRELARLDAALSDILKAARATGLPFYLGDMKAKIDWKTFVAAGTAFKGAAMVGLPISAAVVSGLGAAGAASLSATLGMRNPRNSTTPYEYVVKSHQRLLG